MEIDNYMTPNEAAYRWGLNQETVKSKLKPSINKEEIEQMEKEGLIKSFVRPDGKRKEWIISVKAMEKWFKKEQWKMKIMYEDIVVGTITTNRSMTVDEA